MVREAKLSESNFVFMIPFFLLTILLDCPSYHFSFYSKILNPGHKFRTYTILQLAMQNSGYKIIDAYTAEKYNNKEGMTLKMCLLILFSEMTMMSSKLFSQRFF